MRGYINSVGHSTKIIRLIFKEFWGYRSESIIISAFGRFIIYVRK